MPATPTTFIETRPALLFTDIVQSSQMLRAFGNSAYVELLHKPHDSILRTAIEKHRGQVDGTAGDGFFAVFDDIDDALNCACEIQSRLSETPIRALDGQGKTHTLSLRVGVHTAEGDIWHDEEQGNRVGPDVNFAARIMSQAGGGQILVSQSARAACADMPTYKWQEWPDRWIKSFEDAPQTLHELLWDGGESRGEPGLRWLPLTFRVENDRYVPRPDLQEKVVAELATQRNGGVVSAIVTLWGFGGMGKTRLAIACALQSVGIFTDGVVFVPLADRLASEQSVLEAIGSTLDLESPTSLDDLLHVLSEKAVLLVLDNYESVHCEEVQRLLRELVQQTRQLRLLITGREAVNLWPMEKQIEIRGMSAAQAETLFVSRAQLLPGRDRWQPESMQEREALSKILELTERHALALELVAAQMGRREIVEVADDLRRTPLPSLPAGYLNSSAGSRHHSLTRCLDNSYNLLDNSLKAVFACLSCYADSFDAASITAAFELPGAQSQLDRLYEKSLVTRFADDSGRSRYRFRRPTRAYATERFLEMPNAGALRAQYVKHYVSLIELNQDVNDLGKQAVLDVEWQNALAAAQYANDAAVLSRLSNSMGEYLLLRGLWGERENLNKRTLDYASNFGDQSLTAQALNNLGTVQWARGRWQEAVSTYEQCLAILKTVGDRIGEAEALNNLGRVYRSRGKWEEAISAYEQSIAIKREFGDRQGEGRTLNNLGNVYQSLGQWEEAIDCYKRDLIICREHGDRLGEGRTLNNLGHAYQSLHRWQEAIDCYEQDLVICREYKDPVGEGATLENIALYYKDLGYLEKALEWERESLRVLETTGDVRSTEKVRKLIIEWEKGMNASTPDQAS